jgi:S-adenosylmethionine decarboxylase
MTAPAVNPFGPGHHVLADFWDVDASCDIIAIETALRMAALASAATVVDIRLHGFGENAGITGVALLAESHISIHTWPEISFVALDIFMCGSCNPDNALDVLRKFFKPKREAIVSHLRGLPPPHV